MNFAEDIWGKPNLELVGPAIKYIGPRYWQPRMLFGGMLDIVFKNITKEFPQRLKGKGIRHTHPIFVLETRPDLAHRVCPCSSKKFSLTAQYIAVGCVLDYTKLIINRTSYLVTEHAFLIPTDLDWLTRLRFMGQVPHECIKSITCS